MNREFLPYSLTQWKEIFGVAAIASTFALTGCNSEPAPDPVAETVTATVTAPVEATTEPPTLVEFTEEEQTQLIAIICLASEKGYSPETIASDISEQFPGIPADTAHRLVDSSLSIACPETS